MVDFEEHLEPTRKGPLVFAFASENDHRFEWGHYLDKIHVPHVMFKDGSDQWYAYGCAGIGDMDAIVKYLRKFVTFRDCMALGLSKGAYAALKFASLAKIPRVLALCPVTGCGDYVKCDFPPNWWHRIEHIRPFPIEDLKPLYTNGGFVPIVKAFISDGDGTELDRQMCERVGITDIILIPGFSHSNLARGMRDGGMLDKLMTEPW